MTDIRCHRDLAGLILAAGASTRLGQPKQLLEPQSDHRGKAHTFVADAADKLSSVCGAGIYVVTGAHRELIETALSEYEVHCIFNPSWENGMGSSLRAGIHALPADTISGVLIMLSDQPLIDTGDLARLAEKWAIGRDRPVATRYNNGNGVPAVIPTQMFSAITAPGGTIKKDSGARGLLEELPARQLVDLPGAELDIDTEQDLARYRKIKNGGKKNS